MCCERKCIVFVRYVVNVYSNEDEIAYANKLIWTNKIDIRIWNCLLAYLETHAMPFSTDFEL